MKTKAPTAPAKLKKLWITLAHLNHHAGAKSLHALLSAAVVRCITEGDWSPGDRIPTESELIELSGYSLGTVQRALRSLTEEGVLERKQGSGTFVSKHSPRINDVAHVRFLNQDGKSLLSIYSKVLNRTIAKGRGFWNTHFADSNGTVLQIDRLLKVNDEFEVFNRFYFDGTRFTRLATAKLHELDGANFKTLLEQGSDINWGEVRETLQIAEAPLPVTKAMKLPTRSVMGVLEISRHEKGSSSTLYCQELFTPPSGRKMQLLPS